MTAKQFTRAMVGMLVGFVLALALLIGVSSTFHIDKPIKQPGNVVYVTE